jgi:hypothetical protein
MLVQCSSETPPDAAGFYFLKLPKYKPIFVRVGESGIVTHASGGSVVGMSRQQYDAAQWSERIEFAE